MGWADLTSRKAILDAINEYERLGREQFLKRYGFGRAHKYVLFVDGKTYDAKAIIGSAHGHQFPDRGPLRSHDFASSERVVRRKLESLGFEVRDIKTSGELSELRAERPKISVVASSDVRNWQIGREAGVWGIRDRAKSALAKGRSLRKGDHIVVYISGNGIVAFLELTADPIEPWPEGEEDPWQDGTAYQMKLPMKIVEEFSPPVPLNFDGAFAKSVRIDKFSLLGWGNIDEYQIERIRQIARGEVSTENNEPLTRAWFLVHSQDSKYQDKEGQAYHYPTGIPYAKQIDPGDVVVCYRTSGRAEDAQRIFGVGRIGEIRDDPPKHRFAVWDRYLALEPPIPLVRVGGDPRPNWSHSISSFPPDALARLFEEIGIDSTEDMPEVGSVSLPEEAVSEETDEIVGLDEVVETFAQSLEESNVSFGKHHEITTRDFIVSLATKPFVILTGLSGSGKTRIGQHFGQWLGQGRSKLVPVRPDWTGAEALFGYEDALDPNPNRAWLVPPVLEFMLRAMRDSENPYLLILDEMNLAHVERYFGDFLSGMESEDKDVLPNLYQEFTQGADGRWRFRGSEPSWISIPKNLFVVGTVNVDETTYMFSPKVLDRANTLEFRVETEDLDSDIEKPILTPPGEAELIRGFLVAALDSRFQEENPASFEAELVERLRELHTLLSKGNYEFGHRVVYECIRFAALYESAGGSWPEALDLQILQKILPKLHGSYKRLGPTLHEVAQFTFNPDANLSSDFNPDNQSSEEAVLPLSFSKAQRMYRNLKAYQFTSFTD